MLVSSTSTARTSEPNRCYFWTSLGDESGSVSSLRAQGTTSRVTERNMGGGERSEGQHAYAQSVAQGFGADPGPDIRGYRARTCARPIRLIGAYAAFAATRRRACLLANDRSPFVSSSVSPPGDHRIRINLQLMETH